MTINGDLFDVHKADTVKICDEVCVLQDSSTNTDLVCSTPRHPADAAGIVLVFRGDGTGGWG